MGFDQLSPLQPPVLRKISWSLCAASNSIPEKWAVTNLTWGSCGKMRVLTSWRQPVTCTAISFAYLPFSPCVLLFPLSYLLLVFLLLHFFPCLTLRPGISCFHQNASGNLKSIQKISPQLPNMSMKFHWHLISKSHVDLGWDSITYPCISVTIPGWKWGSLLASSGRGI